MQIMNDNRPEPAAWDYLRDMHRQNAESMIVGAEANGTFIEPAISFLLAEALPVVVDANILRNDIAYAVRHGKRTVLVTATNARSLRLFCASHVYEEVERHADRWAEAMGLDPVEYRESWRQSYVPLLRRVSTDGMEAMLTPEEFTRIERLRVDRDVDDVPSAILALVIGAFFLSEDAAPHEAVHGRKMSAAERCAWLPVIRHGGDSAELYRMVAIATAVPVLGVTGALYAVRALWTRAPALLFVGAALALTIATRVPRSRYAEAGSVALDVMTKFSTHVYEPYMQAVETFRGALPPFPGWDGLVEQTTREAALARACCYRLARSRRTPMTARELGRELPIPDIGRTPQHVGKVIRRYAAFFEPTYRRWQLGSSITS